MLTYQEDGLNIVLNMFRCYGSVFPYTMMIGTPCAAVSALMNYYYPNGSLTFLEGEKGGIMSETQAWSGFSFLLGFLIVFRTTQAYSRFWEGCTCAHRMRAEWFDAVSSIMAFTKHSDAQELEIKQFKELLVRLTSMLHAAALAELEAGDSQDHSDLWAYAYDIIDPDSVDATSLQSLRQSTMKVNLLFQWIQQLIVENIRTGILNIPAPLLSRSFQELANGMVAYHDAMKIAWIPFPFPYSQACDGMLILHWCVVPIVTSQWVSNPIWAALLCFIQVFILWGLNLIAIEIDKPFGKDRNDIDGEQMQKEMNLELDLLLSERSALTPYLITQPNIRSSKKRKTRGTLHGVFSKSHLGESRSDSLLSSLGSNSDCASRASTLDNIGESNGRQISIDVIDGLEQRPSPRDKFGSRGSQDIDRKPLGMSIVDSSHRSSTALGENETRKIRKDERFAKMRGSQPGEAEDDQQRPPPLSVMLTLSRTNVRGPREDEGPQFPQGK